MSKLNEVTSTTNNQSNLAPSSSAPFLLAHDNSKVKRTIAFLYNNGNSSLTVVGIAYHSKAGLRRTKAIIKGLANVSI
jgi:hypothetical protein